MLAGVFPDALRFNRYMVECEYKLGAGVEAVELSFNRYMVECEFVHQLLFKLFKFVLIDTWWNVNLDISIFEEKCNTVLIDTWWNVNVTTSIWYNM